MQEISIRVDIEVAKFFEAAAKAGFGESAGDVMAFALRICLFELWAKDYRRDKNGPQVEIKAERKAPKKKDASKVAGGKARAAKLPATRRTEIAKKAAGKRWKK